MPPQTLGKLLRVIALLAFRTAHVQRPANQQGLHIPAGGNLPQLFEIFPNPGPLQRLKTLRRNAELIADGKANPLLAHIQRQNPPAR